MSRATSPLASRVPVVATVLATVAVLLCVRLVWLGTVAGAQEQLTTEEVAVRGPRGTLWDRSGEIIATESYAYEVGVAPYAIDDPAVFAMTVAPVLGRSASDLAAQLGTERRWLVLDPAAPADVAERLATANLTGLYLTPVPRRAYPLGAAAGQLTGFINMDGDAFYGLEGYYESVLRGRPGRIRGALGTEPQGFRSPTRGEDLILSIDREMQVAAAETLKSAVADEGAVGGTVIVMDPHTGDVLAMASVPSYDPNDYAHADIAAFTDPAVRIHYEPGSVVKAVTMAAALESHVVTPDSTYEDTGAIEYGGAYITNWDQSIRGTISMTELLQHSLNVGAVTLASRMGEDIFYRNLVAFGFGRPTGIDLAGEAPGSVRMPGDDTWTPADLATNSFGQGMSATPIQVAAAIGAIANDGVLVRPRVVRGRVTPDGRTEALPVDPGKRVISQETAAAVRRMLKAAVDNYAVLADVPGFSVAGKTGTSQIPVPGGYDPEDTITSFVGFLPVEKPELLILVKIDRPRNELAADAAAPVFSDVAERAVAILDLTPDEPDTLQGVGR